MLARYIKNEKLANAVEWIFAIVAAVVISLLIRQFIFTTAVVSGPSMSPTLSHLDRVIINRLAMARETFERRDIIAFPYPANPDDKHIKRIIGVPGDYLEMRDYLLYINGELLIDDLSPEGVHLVGDMLFPVTIGEGEYFVLGDNRGNSKDSRFSSVGLIPRESIIGKAWLRFIPINEMGIVR